MRQPDEIVAAARGCIGARFRLHGRDPAFGLDCVGVACVALGRDVEGDYRGSTGTMDAATARIKATGLRQVRPDRAQPGALVLTDGGRGQAHLAILTDTGFVHAHAGLRRVVETPGRPAMISVWSEGK